MPFCPSENLIVAAELFAASLCTFMIEQIIRLKTFATSGCSVYTACEGKTAGIMNHQVNNYDIRKVQYGRKSQNRTS